jgi:hypothetical protein
LMVYSFLYSLLDDSIRLVEIDKGQPVSAKGRTRCPSYLCLGRSLRYWRCWASQIGGDKDGRLLELEYPLPIVLRTDTLPRDTLSCTGRCLWGLRCTLHLIDRLDRS